MRERASFLKAGENFLEFLEQWYYDLPVISWKSLLAEHPPEETAIVAVDVVNGFCKEGNLASPRVNAIVAPVVDLLRSADENGVRNYLLVQDCHPADSLEFHTYPPHCVEGTIETQTVSELTDLPQASLFLALPKRTINPGLEENLQQWLLSHTGVRQFVLVGDCTDICIYLTAMFLKTWFVRQGTRVNVVVASNCVDTYDIPVNTDHSQDVLPHPGELLHVLFLYHMCLNGMQVVREIR